MLFFSLIKNFFLIYCLFFSQLDLLSASYVYFSFFLLPAHTPVKCCLFLLLELQDGKLLPVFLHSNFSKVLDILNFFGVDTQMLVLLYIKSIYSKKGIIVVNILFSIIIPTTDSLTKLLLYKYIYDKLQQGTIQNVDIIFKDKLYSLIEFLSTKEKIASEKTDLLGLACKTIFFVSKLFSYNDLHVLLKPMFFKKGVTYIANKNLNNSIGQFYTLDNINFNYLAKILLIIIKYSQIYKKK